MITWNFHLLKNTWVGPRMVNPSTPYFRIRQTLLCTILVPEEVGMSGESPSVPRLFYFQPNQPMERHFDAATTWHWSTRYQGRKRRDVIKEHGAQMPGEGHAPGFHPGNITAPSTCLVAEPTPAPPAKQSSAVTFPPQAGSSYENFHRALGAGFALNHHICITRQWLCSPASCVLSAGREDPASSPRWDAWQAGSDYLIHRWMNDPPPRGETLKALASLWGPQDILPPEGWGGRHHSPRFTCMINTGEEQFRGKHYPKTRNLD